MTTPAPTTPLKFANRSEQHRRLQALLGAFMNYPTRDGAAKLVIEAMNDYELMARLRQVIPA